MGPAEEIGETETAFSDLLDSRVALKADKSNFDVCQMLRGFHAEQDVTIVCESGAFVKTSRCLLAASSAMLHDAFKDDPQPESGSVVVADGVEMGTLQNLVELLIGGFVRCRERDALVELQRLIDSLGIHVNRCLARAEVPEPMPSDVSHIVDVVLKEEGENPPPAKRPKGRVSRSRFEKKNYNCGFCGGTVFGWANVVVHLERHVDAQLADAGSPPPPDPSPSHRFGGRKDLSCKFCLKGFGSAANGLALHLERHVRLCNDGAALACSDCDLNFEDLPAYFDHERLHAEEAKKECGVCGLEANNAIALALHKKALHPNAVDNSSGPEFKCELCAKVFQTAKKLKVHKKRHFDDEPCKVCDVCGFKARRRDGLAYHMQTHMEVKRYKCDRCEQSFAIKYLLDNHTKKHNGELPYLCDVCGKGFTYIAHMKSHNNLVHRKFFTFQCTICSLKLKSRQNARKHILIHSDIKPYHCSYCKAAFSYQSEIERHRKSGHGGEKFTIRKVMLPIHHEMVEKAIRPIAPEPIPGDFKMAQNCNKDVIKEIRGKKYPVSAVANRDDGQDCPASRVVDLC